MEATPKRDLSGLAIGVALGGTFRGKLPPMSMTCPCGAALTEKDRMGATAFTCSTCGRTTRPEEGFQEIPTPALRIRPPSMWSLAIAGILALATPVIAWFIAGQFAWVVGCILLAAGAIITLKSAMEGGAPPLRRWCWFLFAGLLLAVWIAIGSEYAISEIYVDNLSGTSTRLEVDGAPWMAAPDGTKARAHLRVGKHTIRIIANDGQECDRLEVTVDWGRPYALNVLGGTRYVTGTVQYGNVGGMSGRAYRTDKWFLLGYDYLFEFAPEAVKVREGTKSTTKSYIRRAGRSSETPPALD